MIWAKEESLSRDELEVLQLQRLQSTVHRIYEKVTPYREKMLKTGIMPEDIRSLKDLERMPFTYKQDFRDHYPFGMMAVDKDKMIRVHASSGTTGKPTVVGYTRNDLNIWTDCVTRIAVMGGAKPTDVAQICFGYGMFTGALGLHYGLENLGCLVLPTSTGNTEKQMMYMKDFGTTLLVATPSYALYLSEMIAQAGLDPAEDLKLRCCLVGGEGMSEASRKELKQFWGSDFLATQNYGMSELMGPGVSGECLALNGMHINEDHFIAEIIDPETEEVLAPGELGELVLTCITKEALPLIRYRTRDITRLYYEPCVCGRTTVRMENLSGRSDDMLIIRGVNVFPSLIAEALYSIEGISPHYEIVVDRLHHLDVMEVKVEITDDSAYDDLKQLANLEGRIRSAIRNIVGVDATIKVMAFGTLQRFEGKAKRVTDLRNKP